MKPMSLDELRELAPAYVIGTLTAEELAQFEQAMTSRAIAEAMAPEIAAHRAAAEYLATMHAVQPPPELKQRVLARLSATPRSPATTPASSASATSPTPPRAVHMTPQQIIRRGSRAPWFGMGALGFALAASLVFALDLSRQVRSLTNDVSIKDALLKASQNRLASRDETVRILTDAGSSLVLVRLAVNASEGPDMQLFWNVRNGTAVLHASNFKQVAANRTYCLWMIRDGKPVAVKLFNPDPDGHRLINGIELPNNVAGIAAFAVTEEPAEGSPQPTMTPFLVGTVAPK